MLQRAVAAWIAGGVLAGALAASTAQPTGGDFIRFRDVADTAALKARLENHPTPQKHLIETVPGGVAAFDYNNDGRIDIYLTNGASIPGLDKRSPAFWNRLYRNDGGMRFADVTEEAGVSGAGYSMGVAVADFDNDGYADLFVAGVDRNILYRNTGRSTFEDVTARAGIKSTGWAVGAGWFDFDADGLLDLLVVNYVRWSPADDRFCGDRARNIRVYCDPKYFDGLANTLYHNRGNGTFEDVTQRSGLSRHVGKGMAVAFADYDADGRIDAFVSNDKVPNFLFRNRGDGTFEELGLLAGVALPAFGKPVSSMGVDFRDYDNDGRPDLLVTALTRETFPLFRNSGKGLFDDATHASGLAALTSARSGWGVALADLDNDGWKDLFTANGHVNDEIERFEAAEYKQANSVFRNLGNGRFADESAHVGASFQTRRAHRGTAVADFNGDGKLDVVVTALGEAPELWENVSRGENNWIILDLQGVRSNRDGIGARIRIGKQTNIMTTAVGYASSSRVGVHFGLETLRTVDRIEITWPSGTEQVVEKVAANQILRIREASR